MSGERERPEMFYNQNTKRFEFKVSEPRTNPLPFAEQPKIVQEAIGVIAAKAEIDIYVAEQRARKCGCRNCHFDALNTREWYEGTAHKA